jgi:hypothetical protein
MAIYKLFPTKDATLYNQYPDMNTGLDSITEASSYYFLGNRYKSRYLMQFSTTEILDIIDNKITNFWVSYLRNSIANVSGLATDTTLYIHQVSGSWGMGTGHFGDSPQITNGTSWNYRDYLGSTTWETAGGDTYESPILSQSFSYSDPKDLNVNVTSIVVTWYDESIPNDGFMVKLTSSIEDSTNTNVQPRFKYFSIDTNTIYPPHLEFRWDDSTFDTGSSTNTILSNPESFISVYNNAGMYYPSSTPKFRFSALPKYPDRQFITSSYYTENYYLPENVSMYAIKDTSTNEYVIDFDPNYTKISSDETSSYFDLYMNGLEPERYYTILVKTTIGGVTKVFDENIEFKIVKG